MEACPKDHDLAASLFSAQAEIEDVVMTIIRKRYELGLVAGRASVLFPATGHRPSVTSHDRMPSQKPSVAVFRFATADRPVTAQTSRPPPARVDHRGRTRCHPPGNIRYRADRDGPARRAGISHPLPSRSNSDHFASRTSPDRQAVNIKSSSASLVDMPAPDFFTVSMQPATSE